MDERAAAIRYDLSLPAPFVKATGRGELARRMVKIAREHGVPVVHHTDLAERLICLEADQVIPEELFGPVAAVLAFVLEVEKGVATDADHE